LGGEHNFRMLFKPIRIGKVEIKNRIAMAPMAIGGLGGSDGTLTARAIDYYLERARGGVGLIIAGVAKVENEIERIIIDGMVPRMLITHKIMSSLAELAELVHHYGSKIFIQLTAGYGRVLPGELIDSGIKPVSASAVPAHYRPNVTTRALSTEEIKELVRSFGRAAEIISACEIDGVELHGHQGYLFDQFTTSLWNRRNDEYGGSIENRLRFPIEVIETIKERIGRDFPVVYRYGLKHYLRDAQTGTLERESYREAGRDIEEGLEMAKHLEKAGIDALHVDAGCYESLYWAHPPTYMPHGCLVEMAAEVKKVVKIPVIAVGRLEVPELSEKVLKEGKADMIALGRGLLADPYWPKKVLGGRVEDIRPCIGCNDGCISRIAMGRLRPLSCAVNPLTGRERLYELRRAKERKKVLVAGGGVAGMEAARIAAIRGHKVTLYEKSESLGGHLIEASVPEFKRDLRKLLDWYKIQLYKANINILLNTEATPKLIEEEEPDVVIVATGSKPVQLEVKGMEKSKAIMATDLLRGKSKTGNDVVVIGGGLVGCETALWLANQGKSVTIIEKLHDLMIAGPPIFRANRMMLLDLLRLNKVKFITGVSVHEIAEDGIIIMDKEFVTHEIKCDTIVLALGLKPDFELYNAIKGKVKEVYAIGDCKEPRRILEAIWDGFFVASAI